MSVYGCLTRRFSRTLGVLSKSGVSNWGYNSSRSSSLWEPDYLALAKTKTPEYDLVNVQMKGYDYVALESYQKLVAHLAKMMNLEVSDAWALPSQHLQVQKFKPNSAFVDSEYKLNVYERNVQVLDVKSHILPLFIDAVVTACPAGVNVSVHEHTAELEEEKYVPDLHLMELKGQLDTMGGPRKTK